MRNSLPLVFAALLASASLAIAEPATQPSAREVPLASIHSTSRQKGLQPGGDAPFVEAEGGPSISGVAWALDYKKLCSAKLATWPEDPKKTLSILPAWDAKPQLWMVVYFGATGSNPVQFVIDSVKISKDNVVDVQYHTPPAGGMMTMDLAQYVAWIPLGTLERGRYTLKVTCAGKVVTERTLVISEPAR